MKAACGHIIGIGPHVPDPKPFLTLIFRETHATFNFGISPVGLKSNQTRPIWIFPAC